MARRIDRNLPVEIGPDSVTLGGETYAGQDVGVILCYPNPANPSTTRRAGGTSDRVVLPLGSAIDGAAA